MTGTPRWCSSVATWVATCPLTMMAKSLAGQRSQIPGAASSSCPSLTVAGPYSQNPTCATLVAQPTTCPASPKSSESQSCGQSTWPCTHRPACLASPESATPTCLHPRRRCRWTATYPGGCTPWSPWSMWRGKYSLKTCDSRFLSNDGKLVKENIPTTCFTLGLKSGKLAFKDCDGKYLTPMGPTGTLRSGRCSKPGKDELFDLEESHPQVVFQAANKRFVSVKQGNESRQGYP